MDQQVSFEDFKPSRAQATLFTPNFELSTAKVLQDLYAGWSKRFDGEPTVFPVEAPSEVPRIALQSGTGEWRCQVGAARIDYSWTLKTSDDPIKIEDFFSIASEDLLRYQESTGAKVGRVAAVISRFARIQNPGVFLARHFCKERFDQEPFNEPETFELHAHKRFDMAGKLRVNSWVRSKTGTLERDDMKEKLVLVEQDINTLAEDAEERLFAPGEIRDFYSAIPNEFDLILKMYYRRPEG